MSVWGWVCVEGVAVCVCVEVKVSRFPLFLFCSHAEAVMNHNHTGHFELRCQASGPLVRSLR